MPWRSVVPSSPPASTSFGVIPRAPAPQMSPSSWQPPTLRTRSHRRDLPVSPCVPSHTPGRIPSSLLV